MMTEDCFKSIPRSIQLREKGNEFYKKGNFPKSLYFYNNSIRCSSYCDSNYLYVLGNKSAIQFELRNYKEAIFIINFINSVANAAVMADARFNNKLKCRLKSCQDKMKLMTDKSCDVLLSSVEFKFPFKNSALDVVETSSKGRSVTSNAYLKPAETIFCLKPFAATLGYHYWSSHCYTCFLFIKNSVVIPCDMCSEVQFCSLECQNYNHIHRDFECSAIHVVKQLGLLHLSLVIVLTFYCNNKLNELVEVYCKATTAKSLNTAEQNLITLLYSTTAKDYLLNSCENTIELIMTNFPGLSMSVTEINLKLIITTLACQMIANASSISYHDKKLETNVLIGSGIYPDLAIMNHSCYSNTVCLFNGTAVTVKTTRSISCGSELYNSYGFDFENHKKDFRQKALKDQYEFDCHCEACVNDWKRDENYHYFICPDCRGLNQIIHSDPIKCKICSSSLTGTSNIVNELECIYRSAFTYFENGDVKKTLDILLCPMSQSKVNILKLPDALLLDWNDLMKKVLMTNP